MTILTISEPNNQIVLDHLKTEQAVVFHVKVDQDYFYHPGNVCVADFDHALASVKNRDLVFVNAALWKSERTEFCLDRIREAGYKPCNCQLKRAALFHSQPFEI